MTGTFRVVGIVGMTHVDALQSLTTVGGDLYVFANPVLTNVDGLRNLTSVGGNAGFFDMPELTSLGLQSLASVGGGVTISGAKVTNLNGLQSLTSVGSNITIENNDLLTSVGGLHNLISVGDYISIAFNSALTIFDGLQSLTSVSTITFENNITLTTIRLPNPFSGTISVRNNPALTNLDGLQNLTSIGGSLELFDNTGLTTVDGLGNLTFIGVNLNFRTNPALMNVDGLRKLTTIGGNLSINGTAMTNLNGLRKLISIGGGLTIGGRNGTNPSLTNLDGLRNLTTVVGNALISTNVSLSSFCGLFKLLDGNGLGGSLTISGNAVNPTAADIIAGGPCPLVCASTANAGADKTVYYGYAPQSSATLTATGASGTEPYSYAWSNSATGQSITVSPTTTQTYTVTITDDEGCTASDDVVVTVEDVRCGNNNDKVAIFHRNGNGSYARLCVSPNAIAAHLAHGDMFGLPKVGAGGEETPSEFALQQNYPNPFNPTTVIRYALPVDARVTLEVYDMLGRRVAELVNGHVVAGYHDVSFDASHLASGLYIYRLHSTAGDGKDFRQVRKLMVLK